MSVSTFRGGRVAFFCVSVSTALGWLGCSAGTTNEAMSESSDGLARRLRDASVDSATPLDAGADSGTDADSATDSATDSGADSDAPDSAPPDSGTSGDAGGSNPLGIASVPLAVGGAHACAITAAGGAACWGSNASGALGNDSTTDSSVPVAVSGLASGVAALSAGYYQTCAVTSAGAALCWGFNGDGALGNGTTVDSVVPSGVSGLGAGVAQISVGYDYTCALTTAGGVSCWGLNSEGELGNGTTTASSVPVAVSGLSSGVVAVSAGNDHACALTADGGVVCWGDNPWGQLGNGTTTRSAVPVPVTGLSTGVAAISAGWGFTCALTTSGGVLCWGLSSVGQLGNGTTTASNVPSPVSGLGSGVTAIAANASTHTCALTSGGLWCWGTGTSGELGNGMTANASTPVSSSGSGVFVASGVGDTCARSATGGITCWGANLNGQLGNGTTSSTGTPYPVSVIGF